MSKRIKLDVHKKMHLKYKDSEGLELKVWKMYHINIYHKMLVYLYYYQTM